MNLVQSVILKKVKKISALCHIQSKSGKIGTNVAVLSASHPSHMKMFNDRKAKPQIIKLYDFTKGGSDIVDQLNDYYTTQPESYR